MRRVIPLLLFNVCATEPGLHFQRLKDTIDFRIKNILAILQIKLDFSFKISAICGKLNLRTPLCGLCLNSVAYIYHYEESFSIKTSKIFEIFNHQSP
jgi:hypothetical protein